MADNANIVTVTDQNFQQEVLGSDKPVLVDFWAAWCGPCRMIAPLVEQLADEYAGRAVIAKMDVDENQQIPTQYGIRSIPALIFFKDGQPVDQVVGAVPKRMLAERLDALVGQEV